MRPALRDQLSNHSDLCTECGVCVRECSFLKRYGHPKHIAETYTEAASNIAFECSLCSLCTAVCPEKLDPSSLFLEMRREGTQRGETDLSPYKALLAYESRGTSPLFTWYAIPEGCDTVFFPGCALSGMRPKTVIDFFDKLRKANPAVGIVLDCCMKPSHDLGREDYFHAMFGEMRDFLLQSGVRTVIVACPNCYQVFSQYGGSIKVTTAYEQLASLEDMPRVSSGAVTIHDPCVTRFSESIHKAARQAVADAGLAVEEMPHSRHQTLCCGEGAGVGFVNSGLADEWTQRCTGEAAGRRIITYCAGCSNTLGKHGEVAHLLDVCMNPTAVAEGKVRAAKPPFTYLNRLALKRRLKKRVKAPVTRERKFRYGNEKKKGGLKLAIVVALLLVAFLAVRFTGATAYLQKDKLQALIESAGMLAPVVYIIVYTLAPVLFLPGLPLTVAGGLLFGPFWGVVYAITGATLGACLAFLVARYVAREWVESKLTGPRWEKLHQGVEKHGWKMVAFTRLIPLFPFNLLNYAFGVTRVKFLHYAIATFFCMLPACIAFIVFSSSLLDLLKGKISPAFIGGIVMVVLVTVVPVIYQRRNRKD